jgi:hypothetical protein
MVVEKMSRGVGITSIIDNQEIDPIGFTYHNFFVWSLTTDVKDPE